MNHAAAGMGEIIVRFFLGGAIVSAFAVAGELFEPKTFSGMTAAAPSMALASLALAFAHRAPAYVAVESRSMVFGAVAFFVQAAANVGAIQRRAIPVWLAAIAGWGLWLAVAMGLWVAARAVGVLP